MPAAADVEVHRWLLEGDPAVRWQALRDVLHAPRRRFESERRKIELEGWGARLLSLQAPDGSWGGGLYTPKWTSTHYTLLLLRDFGLAARHAAALKACKLLLDRGLRPDGGVNFSAGARGETCVTGMTLSMAAYFDCQDERLATLVDHLLAEQMDDGGWNCRKARGATHSSLNTTISVLEGLRHYELGGGSKLERVKRAQRRGREFLLAHRLFRSHRTGNVIKSEFLRFVFPPRWHYDVLRALDHFREVGAERDPRLSEAVELVEKRGRADGRWKLDYEFRGKTHFALERVGTPSRWNTLRALRVLDWWAGS